MKQVLFILFAGLLFFGCSDGTGSNTPGKSGNDSTDHTTTPVTKVYLNGVDNLGIKSTSGNVAGLNYSVDYSESDTTSDLITVDVSGDLEPVEQEGGENLTATFIIPIKGSVETVVIYQDYYGEKEAYIVDSSNDAHLLSNTPIDQDGLKTTPMIVYSLGYFYFKSANNDMIKAHFDATGDIQENIIFNDLVYFEIDQKDNFMIATQETVYIAYKDYESTGRIWSVDNTGYFVGYDATAKKLFYPNNIVYAGVDAGGFVFWDNINNRYADLYLNPDCYTNEVFCRPEKQYSGGSMPFYPRQDCSLALVQNKYWLMCNDEAFNAGDINDSFRAQNLSYANITDVETSKKAFSENYLYYGDSDSKLVRIDLANESALILSTDYLIESISVDSIDNVYFSGKDLADQPVLIKVTSDLTINQVDSSGDTIKQIVVIK
jgi:hypothetical protein